MKKVFVDYNQKQNTNNKEICDLLLAIISENFKNSESKIWHGSPVWFLKMNPIVGYSVEKKGVRLLFWSGSSFDEKILINGTGKFKDASLYFADVSQVDKSDIKRLLKKAEEIQWDYKNIVKRKGVLLKVS